MRASDLMRLVRPRQWTKNLAVFAALVFAEELFQPEQLLRASAAFVSLCFVSAALYAINDALDAERDRAHPLKRERPVASGRISVAAAWGIGAACALVGMGLGPQRYGCIRRTATSE